MYRFADDNWYLNGQFPLKSNETFLHYIYVFITLLSHAYWRLWKTDDGIDEFKENFFSITNIWWEWLKYLLWSPYLAVEFYSSGTTACELGIWKKRQILTCHLGSNAWKFSLSAELLPKYSLVSPGYLTGALVIDWEACYNN